MSHPDIKVVFWSSAGTVLYAYFLYPLLLFVLRLFLHRPVHKAAFAPLVSILVPAYNEADVIEAKIRNAESLDYPKDKLELIIASDGSTDATAAAAQRCSDGTFVRTFIYPQNRGKIAVLNETIRQVRGEICIFSDASAVLEPSAIRELLANFADPEVGAVSGTYKVRKASEAHFGQAEEFYWKYETWLKRQESGLGCLVGGHGQILAIRTALYPFPPADTINDDYVIALRILKNGYRVVYEPAAVASEEASEMRGFRRRIRVMAGNIQQLREIGELLVPLQWKALFFFFSHKVMRLLVPFAMACLLVSNLLLVAEPLYRILAVLQFGFFGLALVGGWARLLPRMLRIPYYFCLVNAAVLVALYQSFLRRRKIAWK